MGERQRIRVFVSSPADVRPERLITERLVRRLAREFAHHFIVEPVLWEREPLTAGAHFQDNIVPPRETDLVVCILWSRLGVTLPRERFQGALSGGAVTGTEWEFEDALAGFRSVKRPDLLLYRKTAPLAASLDDDAVLVETRRQRALVEEFMVRWTRDAEGGFTAAFWDFPDTSTFEALLENHLRELLRRRLRGLTADGERVAGEVRWHQPPYRGLLSFEPEHAGVFFGRTRARNDLRELLHRQATRGNAFVLVMGASGSGKSSLVKAGLLPDLKLPGMIGRVGLVRHLIMKPSQGGAEPLGALLTALATSEALPEISALGLRPDGTNLVETVRLGLRAAATSAGLLEGAESRLLVVVDQLEELFTQEGVAPEAQLRLVEALGALARSGVAWVVATMRADFFDALARIPALADMSGGEGRYLLLPPRDAEVGEIIRLPALEAGLRFEVKTDTGEALDEVIRTAAVQAPGALPLLSFLLDQLWQARGQEGLLTFDAYNRLGGLEGALARRAEAVLAGLSPDLRAAFPALLRQLVTIGQGGHGTATSRPSPRTQAARTVTAGHLIDELAQARLLVVEGEMVRLAHEALITHWPRAAEQIATDRDDIERRARIEQATANWERQGRDGSLLLQRGLALSEAEDLLARRRDELPPALVDYVTLSSDTARAAERRRLRRLRATVAVLALLAGGAGIGAWFGFTGQAEAERQATIAERNADEADRRRIDAQGATSRALTEKALVALDLGDTGQAQALLVEALPQPGETPPRPLVPEAVAATRRLLDTNILIGTLQLAEGDGTALAVSDDGSTAMIGGPGHLLVIDMGTGSITRRLPLGTEPVTVARFVGSERLLTVGGDSGLVLRTLGDGQVTARFETDMAVGKVIVSPDGTLVIASGFGGGLAVWPLAGGPAGFTIPDADYAPTVEMQGDLAVAGTVKGEVIAFAPHDGRELWRAPVGTQEITRIAISPDARHVAVGQNIAGITILDGTTGQVLATRPDASTLGGFLFRASGEGLHHFARDATVWTPRLDWGLESTLPMGLQDPVAVAWFETAGIAAILTHERGIEVWNMDLGRRLLRQDLGGTDGIWDRLVSGGGRALAVGRDGRIALLDLSPLLPVGLLDYTTPQTFGAGAETVVASARTGDGRALLVKYALQGLRRIDIESGHVSEPIAGIAADTYLLTSDRTGARIATMDVEGNRVDIIDTGTGHRIQTFTIDDPDYGRPRDLAGFSLSPDGKLLALTWWNGGVLINIDRAEALGTFDLAGGTESPNAFSADGALVLVDGEGVLTVIDTRTTRLRKEIHGLGKGAGTLALSPDGTQALVGFFDGRILAIDLAAGLITREIDLGGLDDAIEDLAFSPDGTTAVAASNKGDVSLFDPATGSLLSRRFAPARTVAVTPRGMVAVAGNRGGVAGARVRWWEAGPMAALPASDIADLARATGTRGLSADERVAAFIDPAPAPLDPRQPPGDLCDARAGDPFDPARQAPGVALPHGDLAFGRGSPQDPVVLACRAAAAASPGTARFIYEEALALQRLGLLDLSRERLDAAVAAGYPAAMVARARLHLLESSDRGKAAAIALLDKALALGNGEAATERGLLAADDPAQAHDWFTRGAELGSGRADLMLGLAHETGSGLAEASRTRALFHLIRASARLSALGPGAAFERDQAMAARARVAGSLLREGAAGLRGVLDQQRAVEGPALSPQG